MNSIFWHNKARKQIKKITVKSREIIFEKIDRLAYFPDCTELDILPLKKHRYGFRMRVGQYRVLFDHDKIIKIIEIQEVKKRDERTY